MKKMASDITVCACCVLALCAIVVIIGCEDDGGFAGLTITPASVSMDSTNDTVVLQVATNTLRALSLPLEWTVRDSSLGNIVSSSGSQAIYVRRPKEGNNIVTAEDQYGAEGSAVIDQK